MPNWVDEPKARLCVGVTGHRTTNGYFAHHENEIRRAAQDLFHRIDTVAQAELGSACPRPRLHSLLAFGADTLAVEEALARGWEVAAPLPFGRDLNIAINAHPETLEDADALWRGERPADTTVAATADRMRRIAERVTLFELADEDERVKTLFWHALADQEKMEARAAWSVLASERAAVAARIMIEQSDLLLALWDGVTPGAVGGTRHTIGIALDEGVPVIWIDVRDPSRVTLLRDREALDSLPPTALGDEIMALIRTVATPGKHDGGDAAARFHSEPWRTHSRRRFHAYRRIEALFGGKPRRRFASLVERYEQPDEIAEGTGADLLARAKALPGADLGFIDGLKTKVLARFALADGVSTHLSDAYRGGMVLNFMLSASAIIVGIAYLPLTSVRWKWPFAAVELLLLLSIVTLTTIGRRRRWHGRWFETRRVAEYLRHAPILLLIGVGRAQGRWPQAAKTTWPERYARSTLRELGLPRARVTTDYLRAVLRSLLGDHVQKQRAYHEEKAARLARVHHNLDQASEALFMLALLSVALFLALSLAGASGLASSSTVEALAKLFTFLGVTLPAVGGAFAGIRYFGDFERFSSISEVTAEKLGRLEARIERALDGPDHALCYARAASLAHTMDEIVVAEIESWQSVFAAKNIAVPV